MSELSVNISESERIQIRDKAVQLFYKTAKARHPNPSFYEDLTKQLFTEAFDDFDQYVGTKVYKHLTFVSKFDINICIGRLIIPDGLNIMELSANETAHSEMLISYNHLSALDLNSYEFPAKHVQGRKVLFPFSSFGENTLVLSEDTIEEIQEHNAKMHELYDELSVQLETLVSVINRCKTTKMFYTSLPNLTSLFPESVRVKVQRKNKNEQAELTAEQQLMQDATNSIATANLLGD